MPSPYTFPCAAILCALALAAHAQETSPAFEASAIVNLDIGEIPPNELSVDSLPAGLGDAEFGLAWKGANGISANAVVVGDEGTLLLDQGWGSIEKGSAKVDFGLFTLPHGINEGRLIHDPLLQEHVESILPGIGTSVRLGFVTPSLAISSREREIEPTDEIPEPGSRPEGVATLALDWTIGEKGLVRASTQLSSDRRDAVLAGSLPVGILLLDAEVAAGSGAARAYDAGFLAGAAVEVTESVQIAARADGIILDDEWTRGFAAGVSWSPIEGSTVACEWLQDLDGDGILTLRLGMELGWKSTP